MNPIFTLNYPELVVAEYLQANFPKSDGYSVLVPTSVQQRGFDLALLRRHELGSSVATFQVKSSRAYPGESTPKGVRPRKFIHNMWLKTFAVPQEADFFVLLTLFAADNNLTHKSNASWVPHMLLFSHREMAGLLGRIRLRKSEKKDTHFGFSFDTASEAFLTRGHAEQAHPDHSDKLIGKRHDLIREWLNRSAR